MDQPQAMSIDMQALIAAYKEVMVACEKAADQRVAKAEAQAERRHKETIAANQALQASFLEAQRGILGWINTESCLSPPLELTQEQAEKLLAKFTASGDWPAGQVFTWQDAQQHWKSAGRDEWMKGVGPMASVVFPDIDPPKT